LYVYFGYPAILWLVSKIKFRPINRKSITSPITIIIPAYNEEEEIEKRIQNILDSNYPEEKIEILVSSDGSTDRTDQIVEKIASKDGRVRLIRSSVREGKTAALNRAVPYANGEILVFTDANTQFEPSALRHITRAFADQKVGCVAGRKVIYGRENNKEAEGLYWKYENFLKTRESCIHSCIGADGSIYGIRKELYCFPDARRGYADDGMISMAVIAQGYRLVYEPGAQAYETTSSSFWREYRRKIRTLSGGLEWMVTLRKLFAPFKSPVWWQLWSHKLLRFTIPFFLVGFIASSAFLSFSHASILYRIAFGLVILLYTLGIGAILGCPHKVCRLAFYLGYMNFAFLSALLRFLTRRSETTWEKLGR